MPGIDALKAELGAAIDSCDADGRYDDAGFARVHAAIAALVPFSPIARPIDAQERIAGPWASWFAQFGPKHTAGKPIVHETSFKFLTFNKLPDRPLRLLHIEQEIHHRSMDYNNVHLIESLDGALKAELILFGRYAINEAEPKRYSVDFDRIALRSRAGASEAALREAFGFAADQPLDIAMKPPALHSDVVFCDDDIRINFGSMGGVYVMKRSHHGGISVAFP